MDTWEEESRAWEITGVSVLRQEWTRHDRNSREAKLTGQRASREKQ